MKISTVTSRQTKMISCAKALGICASLFFAGPALAGGGGGKDEKTFKPQPFLFLLPEAYIPSGGHWLAGATFDQGLDSNDTHGHVELGYSLTDRIQLFAGLPILDHGGYSGVGDAEFGLALALAHEDGGATPQITASFAALAPTGDDDHHLGHGDWGYKATLRGAKRVTHNVYTHLFGAYEWVPNGGPHYDEIDKWFGGAGVSMLPTPKTTLTLEYLGQWAREDDHGHLHKGEKHYVSVGGAYEVYHHVHIGPALAIGLNDAAEDARAMFMIEAVFH